MPQSAQEWHDEMRARGRPTGAEQFRGSFLASWDEVLPARPRAESRADLDAVARRLVELAGSEIPRG